MSISTISESIEYPESDGKPMGETDLHRDWMVRILEILRQRYRNQNVYIASDLLVYYEEGNPSKFIVPDDFIVLDCNPGRRRTFKTWVEKRVPDVVFEVTSSSSRRKDTVKKPLIYKLMGVKEYFVYDPTCDYLNPALQGFRTTDGSLTQIVPVNGVLRCETLQLGLRLVDGDLEFFDIRTGALAVDEAEAEREAKEAERAAKEVERAAKEVEREAKEVERAAKEQECEAKEQERAAKEQERAAKEQERAEKEKERAARERAEAKNRELMLEIEQLKKRLGEERRDS